MSEYTYPASLRYLGVWGTREFSIVQSFIHVCKFLVISWIILSAYLPGNAGVILRCVVDILQTNTDSDVTLGIFHNSVVMRYKSIMLNYMFTIKTVRGTCLNRMIKKIYHRVYINNMCVYISNEFLVCKLYDWPNLKELMTFKCIRVIKGL